MLLQRCDLPLIRAMALALLGAATLGATGARAQQDLPSYPLALSQELAPPPAVPAPSAAPQPAAPGLALTLTPLGVATSGKPLPPGATAVLNVIVRNGGPDVLARIVLTARADGLKPEPTSAWRIEGNSLVADLVRVGSGATAERRLVLLVDRAALFPGAANRIAIEARADFGPIASAELSLRTADCAGAYHARISVLRTGVLQTTKNEADAIRKSDPAWPRSRSFSATGARTGPIANAERLAAYFLTQGGADAEFGRETLRFNIVRWASDLTAYSTQSMNPALCSGTEQLVTRYRDMIAPSSRRIEATRAAALNALEAARHSSGAEPGENLARIVRRAIEKAGLKVPDETSSPLAALSSARASLNSEKKPDAVQMETLSLAETAAVLAEAANRVEKLARSIDATLAAIATAAKETCLCAY
jgi:hypothetical protein